MEGSNEKLTSSVKNKLKQGFSAFDLITTMLAVIIVCAITAPILFKSGAAHDLSVANAEAIELSEKLTKELLSQPSKNDRASSRMPASAQNKGTFRWEGLVAKDPWGQAYSFKVLRDAYGLPTHMLVWSKGPNGVQDTPDNELQITKTGFKLRMDDLGHIKEIY